MKNYKLITFTFLIIGIGTVFSQETTASNKKVLFVLSGVDYVNGNKNTNKTGYWLEEFSIPYKLLTENNIEVVIATPNGHAPSADALSYAVGDDGKPLFWNSKEELEEALAIKEVAIDKGTIENLAVLNKKGLDSFDAIFFPGGHGPMQDLAFDENVAKTLRHFHTKKKITALVCHGPAALLSTLNGDSFPYKGYKVSGFRNTEEKGPVYETLGGFKDFEKVFGGKLETALIAAGMLYQKGNDWQPYIVEDRELITGQNPASSKAVAEAIIQRLK
jgi:putative intracellular protease/amidase